MAIKFQEAFRFIIEDETMGTGPGAESIARERQVLPRRRGGGVGRAKHCDTSRGTVLVTQPSTPSEPESFHRTILHQVGEAGDSGPVRLSPFERKYSRAEMPSE